MSVVRVNGVNLNYETAGQGNAVFFLHGMTGSNKDWTNQMLALSPKYKVVAWDNRGHGKSDAPSEEEQYSIKIFADDLFNLLKQLDIKKCCIVGHSFGGFVALQFALEHQDMLTALVLVDTSSGTFTRDPSYAVIRQKQDELALSQGTEAAFEYEAAHNPMRIATFEKHPEQKEVARRKVRMTSVNGYIYVPRAFVKWQPVTPRLSEINVPALIFWGDEDVAFTEAVQVLKEGITDAELITVKGVGHSPHEDAPDIVNEALLNFLDKISW